MQEHLDLRGSESDGRGTIPLQVAGVRCPRLCRFRLLGLLSNLPLLRLLVRSPHPGPSHHSPCRRDPVHGPGFGHFPLNLRGNVPQLKVVHGGVGLPLELLHPLSNRLLQPKLLARLPAGGLVRDGHNLPLLGGLRHGHFTQFFSLQHLLRQLLREANVEEIGHQDQHREHGEGHGGLPHVDVVRGADLQDDDQPQVREHRRDARHRKHPHLLDVLDVRAGDAGHAHGADDEEVEGRGPHDGRGPQVP
mmetsp:Transcript_6846/g.12943  ORF Transcript_6846/g.12943 Transcript_6846/m.12943 type:complete len:248 (-) Transcript_6846:460-1203(-)